MEWILQIKFKLKRERRRKRSRGTAHAAAHGGAGRAPGDGSARGGCCIGGKWHQWRNSNIEIVKKRKEEDRRRGGAKQRWLAAPAVLHAIGGSGCRAGGGAAGIEERRDVLTA